jgi:DNA-binding MarR family transcriptional regulator
MTRRPIGYWLKRIDHQLNTTFEHALATEGLTRRHWQVLNTVATGPTTRTELDTALAPFLADDPHGASRALDDLIARGWVTETLSLTSEGRTGHASVSERTQQVRRSLMTGISDEEYVRTVDILEQMAHNLEPIAG